ncbi:MAG: hypothetical protein FJ104_07185 [Deltaproteobacteria bacterium]|nr:hypothetical protein [Deltaproteobacteria bacterium]
MSALDFISLTRLAPSDLRPLLEAGVEPRATDLIGWEFRGWNVLAPIARPFMAALGFQRFAKGFFSRAPEGAASDESPDFEGYNLMITAGSVDDPWVLRDPAPHSFYRAERVGAPRTKPDLHPHALLLDYALGDPRPPLFEGGPLWGNGGIFDFLVHPSPGSRDLLLGVAYYSLPPIRVLGGYFVAERWRRAEATVPPPSRR